MAINRRPRNAGFGSDPLDRGETGALAGEDIGGGSKDFCFRPGYPGVRVAASGRCVMRLDCEELPLESNATVV